MLNRNIVIVLLLPLFLVAGCKKYLDKKSNTNLSVPDNLEDIDLLLNNVTELNGASAAVNSASDEYYLAAADWETATLLNRDSYVWNPEAQDLLDWQLYYRAILTANTVLENMMKIPREQNTSQWDNLKGRALFVRGWSHFQLAQIFTPPFLGNEGSSLGLPLRTSADFNKPVSRAGLKDTYDQILADILASAPLLPDKNLYNTQASKWAALAMAARIFLIMGDYQQAYNYSNQCLKLSASLMDYNMLDATQDYPFSKNNPEIIYFTSTENTILAYYWVARVDSLLHKTYTSDDLRRQLYFINNADGSYSFKGNYTNSYFLFNGLATDEVFLIKAESAVRLNEITEAQQALNLLLRTRWANGKYTEITITDPKELLRVILLERRKELLNRGIRWSDLRRLNSEEDFQITLNRNINGTEYKLAPNDLRYVYLIPQETINISGIPQNPR